MRHQREDLRKVHIRQQRSILALHVAGDIGVGSIVCHGAQ